MKTTLTLFSSLILVLFAACSSNNDCRLPPYSLPDAKPIVLKPEFDNKLKNSTDFSIDLFKTTYKHSNEPNIFVSPLSVDIALSMTWGGAAGDTKTEMQKTIHNEGYTTAQINEYYKTLREALIKVDPSAQLSIANSIWYKNGFSVNQSFIEANRLNYSAEVTALDFASSDAAAKINSWCAKNTNNKIPKIMDNTSGNAMMYLINAIYFKGMWKYQFDKKDTSKSKFKAEDGEQDVNMMSQKTTLFYNEDTNARYVELPYGNKAFSMVVALPQTGKKVDDIINNLNSNSWNTAIKGLRAGNIDIKLPRFKLECEYEMNDKVLPDMGMVKAFIPDQADFSGMASNDKLYISQVKHKTFIEVGEEGTEAAAVTSVEIAITSPGPTTPIIFNIDQPFVFAIKENSTGVILFIGKIGKITE